MCIRDRSTSTPLGAFFVYNKDMSTLHHESILENLYEEVLQEAHDTGNIAMMNSDDIEFEVRSRFEALCQ